MTDDIDAQAARELEKERPKFVPPPAGVDRGPALPGGPEAEYLGQIAWEALSKVLDLGWTPRAAILDPGYCPTATALLGLPIERRPGLGYGKVVIAVENEMELPFGY